MFLEKNIFSSIIENTPLISIDLIVRNQSNEILLGERLNKPAKSYWFVPGGRIYKDESINDAFSRISEDEIGIKSDIENAKFLGVYQHLYEDNVFNDNFSTHYVVLGFELVIEEKLSLDTIQHKSQKWFKEKELLDNSKVHDNVKDYFKIEKGIR